MKPILFREDETAFTSNGLGRIDALKCEVTEERNGQFELEMDVSIDDRHFQDIVEGRILLARHDDTVDKQPFEIYQISKPLNGRVTVYAHHISYRTEKITVTPFAAQNDITAAMNAIQTNCVGSNPFVLWTDKSTAGKFSMTKPATLRSLLGGSAGSLLDVYGTGEYEWDKFTIKLRSRRGRDTGVVLRYGKNITDLKKVSDTSSVWTGVVPFWAGVSEDDPDNEELVMLPEVVLYSSAAANYAYAMIVPLDLSGNFEEKPTETQLRNAAQNYVDNNEITAIPASIDVSFVAAWQTDEYKNVAALERLSLCDTLTVRYTKLGVDNQAKIIKTVFDVLKEKYISMTVGDVRPNLATEISGGLQASVDEIRRSMATRQRVSSVVNAAVENATAKITGGDGGYIVIKRDANGNPREILAMNTDDVDTATNVLRINMNGIGFSSSGINGPYRSAWTLDGAFVADFITSGTMLANRISGGLLTDLTGDNTWNLQTGAMNFRTLSWNSQNSSMTADGVLTCNGATITGHFSASYVPDATPQEIGNNVYKIALEESGFNFYSNNVLSGSIHEDVYYEIGRGLVDDGMVIEDVRGNGATLASTGSSFTVAGNDAAIYASGKITLDASGKATVTSASGDTLIESQAGDVTISANETLYLSSSQEIQMSAPNNDIYIESEYNGIWLNSRSICVCDSSIENRYVRAYSGKGWCGDVYFEFRNGILIYRQGGNWTDL